MKLRFKRFRGDQDVNTSQFVIYRDIDGYRWVLAAGNGKVVCESSTSFTSKKTAERSVKAVQNLMRTSKVSILKE